MVKFNNGNHDRVVAVPNTGPIGTDRTCSSIVIPIPILFIEDCMEQVQWHPEPMDFSSAARLQAMASVSGTFIHIISVPLILPTADDVNEVSSDLDQIRAEPIRVTLKTPSQR